MAETGWPLAHLFHTGCLALRCRLIHASLPQISGSQARIYSDKVCGVPLQHSLMQHFSHAATLDMKSKIFPLQWKARLVYGALNTREEKCEPYCLLVGYGSVFQHSLTLPPLPISSNSGKEKKCLAFLELAQVKQIMDLSLFITFVMQKPKSPALLLPKTERALLYFLWAKQLWWILNPLMTGKAKTNVAIFIWGRGFGVLMKKWHCKLLKMFCPLFNTVNTV